MSDLVGNPEDRFSHKEAQNTHVISPKAQVLLLNIGFIEHHITLLNIAASQQRQNDVCFLQDGGRKC